MPHRLKYPLVQPIEEWAILKLSDRREEVVNEVIRKALRKVIQDTEKNRSTIEDQIAKTMYMERIRMKDEPWSIDPKDERDFWRQIKKRLIRNEQQNMDLIEVDRLNMELLREIVQRYTEEIIGNFHIPTFKFARTVLPFLFSRILNAVSAKGLARIFNPAHHMKDKFHLTGEIESLRALSQKGTVILLPTHSSNLDSILIGWAIDHLGLPPFIYGAGLNLFNSRIFGFFMNRLGAYKVDRRKKNLIYNETLKTFSTIAIQSGCHSLFFPGGTRSRSGALETKLKLGLVGTALEAQRLNFMTDPDDSKGKIYVVPLVLNYHFVLEAPSLILQHLNNMGQDKFFVEDESSSYWQVVKFLWKLFSKGSELELSFGKPMDVFGNFVNNEGTSFDKHGRKIDTIAYFSSKGEITEDLQRDAEYTRMLGEKVAERFKAENVVFSSNIVAFVGFNLIRKRYKSFGLDLYSLLRIPKDDRGVHVRDMIDGISRLLEILRKKEAKGEIRLAEHLKNKRPAQILRHGVNHLGLYNERMPLYFQGEGYLHSQSFNLLFFYHNRLTGYGFEEIF